MSLFGSEYRWSLVRQPSIQKMPIVLTISVELPAQLGVRPTLFTLILSTPAGKRTLKVMELLSGSTQVRGYLGSSGSSDPTSPEEIRTLSKDTCLDVHFFPLYSLQANLISQ